MLVRLAGWALLLLSVLLVLAALALHISARAALDHDYGYTRAAAQLPEFRSGVADGLARIAIDELDFRVRVAGFERNSGPVVILLHGFPANSAMYSDLLPRLVDAGYRVLAPDQRGYSPGARPQGSENYSVDKLGADVLALADAVGAERFHLVGHDWGAVVGWQLAIAQPGRVLSWSALSIPHPAAFAAALENDPEQRRRSAYFYLFATPWLAESLFASRDFALMRDFLTVMKPEQRSEYLAMLREPGALTAAFNWYRAMLSGAVTPGEAALQVEVPTLFVWGNRDLAVARYGVQEQARYIGGDYEVLELDAGHWLFREAGEATVAAITGHIGANDRRP